MGTTRREPSFFDPRKIAFKLTREPTNSRVTEVLIKRTDSRARDFIGHFSTVEYSRICLELSNPDKVFVSIKIYIYIYQRYVDDLRFLFSSHLLAGTIIIGSRFGIGEKGGCRCSLV